ncbi:MAG TPA: nitrite/sulfite reductase, partial [Nitrososphaeraceae archaeon]|nr:nitrite/sulfite reductase [Nitrososphaeraceae archaeon]
AGLTTREACGNTVRNVMCSHFAGVCPDEEFDSTPYSKAIARFFLRNPVCQNLPRKFKINFACCSNHGLVRIADIGLIPMKKDEANGFKIYLGGGLGAASFIGHQLEEFTPEDRVVSTCMAVVRLFDRLGNRENMARNRMRYLVNEMGWEKFQKLVIKERSNVEMTISLETLNRYKVDFEGPSISQLPNGKKLPLINEKVDINSDPYKRWIHSNVVSQKQNGYFVVFVTLGAGDITSNQLRSLAKTIQNYSGEGCARNTPNQNFAVRFVKARDLQEFYNDHAKIVLANPGALTMSSTVGCSGTTSCNLALTNSHRLAKEIQSKFIELGLDTEDDLRDSTIKISGCPNSCGQHEIATIGFYGGASRIDGTMTPTYTMMFGGRDGEDGMLGRTVMRVPAKRVISTIIKIIEIYRQERSANESLTKWIGKLINGAVKDNGEIKNLDDIKKALMQTISLPNPNDDPESYMDYGNDIKFSAKTAKGECAA